MKVHNHFLLDAQGAQVVFRQSPNQSAGMSQLYLVIHYTAGTTLEGAVSWFLNPAAQASAHLVIGRDGAIVQMVTFDRRAWHAGKSKWGELEGLNQYAIGIELVNAGKLRKRVDGKWIDWAGNIIPDDEVTSATHEHENTEAGWHEYTDVQIATVLEAAIALHSAYRFADILGHDDISPTRKVDPGPLFPMNSFRSKVLGRA
jgi:N-acetylmuramoyl-L-alanine amidase